MKAYYQARAREYEAIYAKPERQDDLARLQAWLAEAVRGRSVIEVACGTGYWTAVAAAAARSIVATDINEGPLAIARAKGLAAHVRFAIGDAYAPQDAGVRHDAGMAHFWWSHVAKADQMRFLAGLTRCLAPGARLLMIDNRFAAASSTAISRRDASGNTYQARQLADGSTYEVLKNFPSPAELRTALGGIASSVEVLELDYFWAVNATLRVGSEP